MTDEQLDNLATFESSSAFGDLEKSICRFADQLSRDVEVDASVVERLKQDLSSEELVELAVTVGAANLTNRFNHAFDIPLED